jgi:hypothetical protein
VEIVEQDLPAARWRPWGPPTWLIALGLCAALALAFVRAAEVQDPRLVKRPAAAPTPTATPCAQQIAEHPGDPRYVWPWCK